MRRSSVFWLLLLLLPLSGCSLLEVKLDSQTTPLTQQELNMRLLTREYTQQFFSQVEQAADTIAANYDPQDKLNQSYVLLWKINAEEGLQRAAYQVSPTAALIDSWVFTEQMNQFFNFGAGSELFTTSEAKQVSQTLAQEVDKLAKSLLKGSSYKATKQFVIDFAAQHPFEDLSFIRTPAYRAWLEANQISETEAVSTLGTMPEALGDVSDRLSLVSEQTPKLMTWKAQLIAMNSSISGEQLTATLQSLQATSESFQDFVENNPEYMENLAEQMALQLQPLVKDIDARTAARLDQLSLERQALEEMVARERAEIALIVSAEREKFTQDLDKVSQDVLTLAMDKLVELIKSTIIYFVLFIVAIFFAPLGLGYLLGKRSAVKKSA
ncbi:chemotaxis protein [Vibrio brasiliensis]|uniref:chemotaxis protein n=1 Tax=Vibrio brasiliensis TaxID=170652 RepID=UPI001EFE2986|nr:chemotaxis protein [Vibrio brasiliensis]MCG9725849.1 chemotaxis protein [Vibrio brasiliensis]